MSSWKKSPWGCLNSKILPLAQDTFDLFTSFWRFGMSSEVYPSVSMLLACSCLFACGENWYTEVGGLLV